MYHKPNSYCSYLHQLSYRTGSHDVYRQLELTKPHLSDLFSPSCRIHPMAITVSWDINFWESLRYREVALDNLIYYLKYLYLKYGNTYIYIYIVICLVVLTILRTMKVNGKDYPIYYGTYNMFAATLTLRRV